MGVVGDVSMVVEGVVESMVVEGVVESMVVERVVSGATVLRQEADSDGTQTFTKGSKMVSPGQVAG